MPSVDFWSELMWYTCFATAAATTNLLLTQMFVSHAESKRIKVEIFGLKTKKQLEVWIEKM